MAEQKAIVSSRLVAGMSAQTNRLGIVNLLQKPSGLGTQGNTSVGQIFAGDVGSGYSDAREDARAALLWGRRRQA